jgi:site-specific DNA-methyltransferase (adenine-specific)
VTPYYDDGKGIVIYNGDCREVMPELGRFDLLLTDPPYGIEWNTNYSRFTNSMQAAPRVDHPAIINDETDEMMSLALSWEGMKIVWGAHLSPWLIKERGSWLVWDKRFENGKAMLADAELAYYSKGTGVYIHKHTWQGMIGDKSGTPRVRHNLSSRKARRTFGNGDRDQREILRDRSQPATARRFRLRR